MNWGTVADWVTPVAGAMLGGLAGYMASVRHDGAQRRERLGGIAGALHADILRIREQLGEPGDRYIDTVFGDIVKACPQLHEWTRGLMSEAALISPAVVSEFMSMERSLKNFEVNVLAWRQAITRAEQHREAIREAEASGTSGVVAIVNHRRALREPQEAATVLHAAIVARRKDAWESSYRIVQLLQPFLPGAPPAV